MGSNWGEIGYLSKYLTDVFKLHSFENFNKISLLINHEQRNWTCTQMW